jgi:hypothetical protein
MNSPSKFRLLLLGGLLLVAVLTAIPYFAKARRTTSINSCQFNLMWIETAKAHWALDQSKSPDATPTPDELLPYLARVTPMWDRRHVRTDHPPDVFPTCFLTNAPYLLGTVSTRVACPTVRTLPDLHAWDEAEYRYHYDLETP